MTTYTLTRRRLEPLATNPHPLGRHVNHDSRSRLFAYEREASVFTSVRHERHIPVLDQGDLGSCTGNAALGCLGTGLFYTVLGPNVIKGLESEAVSFYSDATRLDGYDGTYPPTDTGSDGLSVAKAVLTARYISGYQHALNFTAAMTALQHNAVITGITWYEGMFNPDSKGNVKPTGDVAGGHEFCVDEIDMANSRVGFTNSWGSSWGIGGRAYLSFSDWENLLKDDGDVTIFVPLTQAPPQPKPPAPVDDAVTKLAAATKKFRGSIGWGGYSQAKQGLKDYLGPLGY